MSTLFLSYRGHCFFLSLHSRPTGPPCGRPSVVISAGPKPGEKRNEHTGPRPGYGQCGVKYHERPLQRDVPGAAFFTRQTFKRQRRCEESRHRTIHGDTLSGRVSANGVGRRGPFLEGRLPFRFEKCCPSGKGSSGGAPAHRRRPGLESRDRSRRMTGTRVRDRVRKTVPGIRTFGS